MIRSRMFSVAIVGYALGVGLAAAQTPSPTIPQRKPAPTGPRLVPVAETKLLMEALNQSNFHGLERILQQKEIDAESWQFARGQALLISETGNLLMMRPPKSNTGTDVWMKAGTELRDSAAQLAKTVATRDQERSRAGLLSLANTCNRCHQSFRVPVKISAFEDSPPPLKP